MPRAGVKVRVTVRVTVRVRAISRATGMGMGMVMARDGAIPRVMGMITVISVGPSELGPELWR